MSFQCMSNVKLLNTFWLGAVLEVWVPSGLLEKGVLPPQPVFLQLSMSLSHMMSLMSPSVPKQIRSANRCRFLRYLAWPYSNIKW